MKKPEMWITSRLVIAEYRVRLQAEQMPDFANGGVLRGSVVILGWPQSILGEVVRGGGAALMRELGF